MVWRGAIVSSCDPFAYQAAELLELARAVDATRRVLHLGIFRLTNGECRAAMQSRRGLFFRAIPGELVPDTGESRSSHASARANLYEHAAASFSLERVPFPTHTAPLPWLPPQDDTTAAVIASLEAQLDFGRVSEATTCAIEGLGRRWLVTAVPAAGNAEVACLLERSVRASDGDDDAAQLAHLCRLHEVEGSLAQLRAYARSIGATELVRR